MHNPAGLALFSRRQLRQTIIIFLAWALVALQVPILADSGFFSAVRSAFFDISSSAASYNYFENSGSSGDFDSTKNSQVAFAEADYDLSIIRASHPYPEIRALTLNLSGIRLVVVDNPGEFGKIFVGFSAHFGFHTLTPLRTKIFSKAVLHPANSQAPIERENFVSGNLARSQEVKKIQDGFSRQPKILVLLC